MRKLIKLISAIFLCSALSVSAHAVEELHFVVPGGAGGGWDGCARGTGEALVKSGLLKSASFENMSGGGGGKANTPDPSNRPYGGSGSGGSGVVIIRYKYQG